MIDTYKALRIAQGALLLAAALTGLSWFEDARGQETREIGSERLTVDLRAPVQDPKGPWDRSTVFTEEHEGVPLDVAPNLNVTARYATDGVTASDRVWSAELEYEATGDSGKTWWSTTTPVALNTTDTSAQAELDLPAIVQEARSMEAATDIPTRLSIRLEIHHEATVTVDGDARETSHTTAVDLVPKEGWVVPQTDDDSTTYAQPVEAGIDWLPIALAGSAVFSEGPAAWIRRRRDPCERAWGVDRIVVQGLEIPSEAATADLGDLLPQARDRGGSVYVDEATGRVLAPGDPPLVGHSDGSSSDTHGEILSDQRPALPTRPPVPGRRDTD